MQAYFETIFDIIYLAFVLYIGVKITKEAKTPYLQLFGIMAITLGAGDFFHLAPRSYALLTTGIENNVIYLGIGKFITSITMTIFYVILYHIWKQKYQVRNTKVLTYTIHILAAARILICLFPQNGWLVSNPPLAFALYRNLPFAIIGLILIVLFKIESKKHNDQIFKYMPMAITLSFLFYIPVVIYANTIPAIGALMIPKTIAYVWIVVMGYQELKLKEK